MRWWALATHVAARLTTPRADAASADAAAAALLSRSRIGRTATGTAEIVRRAWIESRVRAAVEPLRREWHRLDRRDAIRAAGVLGATAALVVLALQTVQPTPPGPFVWMLPLVVLIAGTVAMVTA